MEKYVIPPFYYSDFKFPSVNKALLKEVKLIFAELAAISLRPPRYKTNGGRRRPASRRTVAFFTIFRRRAVSLNGSWRGVTFFAVQPAALAA